MNCNPNLAYMVSAVKRILEWHQGEIKIDDALTLSGAKFTISLPKFEEVKDGG
ncbi:MAG: HAMP domain-containing histidine kinase [Alteromonadaceae bacterium]|nr:HAMP domain-containing histidine kinase [Alteromonadaceae bacterium]